MDEQSSSRGTIIQPDQFEHLARYQEPRSYILPIIFFGFLIVTGSAAGGYYFYANSELFSPFKPVYNRLGIDLPRSFERFEGSFKYLDQLRREPCDSDAMSALVPLIEKAGYPRESAASVETFSTKCTASSRMFRHALNAYTRLGDHAAATRMADAIVRLYPTVRDYRYWRGQTYEKSKNYKAALADYISSVDLAADLSKVGASDFYNVSRMYEVLGRPCDAISPLETYISYNVKERQTQQIAKIISDYSKAGKCAATYATGSARIVIPPTNMVDVTINGVRARMILDTGASQVSITPQLAARARITPDEGDLVEVKTVGGNMKQATGYAQSLSVGSAAAANVPLLIAVGSDNAFGNEIDGLLGMTYLSRFNVVLAPGTLELTQKNRN
jgi:aspartyl protease family protein